VSNQQKNLDYDWRFWLVCLALVPFMVLVEVMFQWKMFVEWFKRKLSSRHGV